MRRSALLAIVLALAAFAVLAAGGRDSLEPEPAVGGAKPAPLLALVGALHEHSGYSDGPPGTRPADYYAAGREAGLDFLGGSEHAESLAFPGTFSEDCLDPVQTPTCVVADQVEPENSARKWEATAEQAAAATDERFAGIRGFEWSSDRQNHLGVFFSRNHTTSDTDGSELTMDGFWDWFTRAPESGGGADGLGVFNHPGLKDRGDDDPSRNWSDFAHVPAADERMVGVEVFSYGGSSGRSRDYGSAGPPEGWYARALDRGWHVGAIAGEDLHDDWAGPEFAKTVVLASERTPAAIREGLLARRFYAVLGTATRLAFTVDGEPMGSRLERPAGRPLAFRAAVSDPAASVELVTAGGRVVATGAGSLRAARPVDAAEGWYFVRARSATGAPLAYSSPVWVTAVGKSPSRPGRPR